MDTLFLKPLNMSIAAGWLILVVMVLRVVLKKAPKYIRSCTGQNFFGSITYFYTNRVFTGTGCRI